jgi:hypothetical protein
MTGSQRSKPAPFRADPAGAHARSVDRTDLHALLAILGRIMAVCRNDLLPATDRESLRRWEDDHYVYFEDRLLNIGRDVDINVHEGRFMARLTKLADSSGLERVESAS